MIETVRGPGVALAATATEAVNLVAELRTTDDTVTPGPKDTVPPPVTKFAAKPLPLICTLVVRPWRSTLFDTEVAVGMALTVNAAVLVTKPPSGFVNVTSRNPSGAPALIDTMMARTVGSSWFTWCTVTPGPGIATVAGRP